MRTILRYCACVLALWLVSICSTHSQDFPRTQNPIQPVEPFPFSKVTSHDPNFVRTSPVSFYKRKAEWRKIVDEFWGPGLPLAEKHNVFQIYADYVRATNPTLGYSRINWDSVSGYWRQKITDSTSRGGFSAILSRLAFALGDAHARAIDSVMFSTPLNPGTPILVSEPRDIAHFGAGMSVLPDSSLLVCSAVSNHPLGLEPGDIVLGYEGVPWRHLVRELLAAQLPMIFMQGSAPSARSYSLLSCAGQNWHLFDTIDVVKYKTGATVHLPTNPLTTLNVTTPMVNSAQMPIAGVPMPVYDLNHGAVTYGIVAGEDVGYIYVYHHGYAGVSTEFALAVSALKGTEGLIIDIRFNTGGSYGLNAGIDQLMNPDTETLVSLRRSNASDLWSLYETTTADFSIPNNYTTIYDRPIAVLLGPACVSYGDMTSWQLRYVPGARFFGKSPMAAYSGYWWNTNGPAVRGFDLWSPNMTAVDHRSPNEPRWGKEFPLDEEVWLTRDGVAKGEDDVVKRALQWISIPFAHDVQLTHPSRDTLRITARLQNPLGHSLKVTAILKDGVGAIIDSLFLKDDGLHGDGAAGDGVWGYVFVPAGDASIHATIRTDDLTAGTSRTQPDAATILFTRGALISVDTRAVDLGSISRNTLPYDTTFLARNIGYLADSLTVSLDPVNVVPDTAVSAFPTAFVLAPGDSQKVTFRIRPSLLPPANYFAQIMVESKSAFGQTRFEKNYQFEVVVTGSVSFLAELPTAFMLDQNFPNPFNPSTTIRYGLPNRSKVTLTVFNTLGQRVAELVNGDMEAGYHEVKLDASGLSSGVYFYRLRAGEFMATRRLLLIR